MLVYLSLNKCLHSDYQPIKSFVTSSLRGVGNGGIILYSAPQGFVVWGFLFLLRARFLLGRLV